MNQREGSHDVWKWVAAVLVAVMLAGAPAIIQAIRAPSQEQVDVIRERQVQVLERLAVIEARLMEIDRRLFTYDQRLHDLSERPR